MKLVQHRVLPWRLFAQPSQARQFSLTHSRLEIKSISELPSRIKPSYIQSPANTLLSLQWPSPPRNVLVTKKKRTPNITESVLEFTTHIHSTYPSINIILEPESAQELHEQLPFPVYTYKKGLGVPQHLSDKTDLVCTLGGDGTLLRASSLFSQAANVPPVLSFAMGTIGFLGEFKFREYKRAFREVYMSGAPDTYSTLSDSLGGNPPRLPTSPEDPLDKPLSYADIRGKAMGSNRTARILLRNRLKVGVFGPDGKRIGGVEGEGDTYALNEVTLHRGSSPHLKIIDVYINNRFLTEAVADGMIISSPTGSTAYSLSSGGSIVHPLVPSLLVTPICPRSLSFRPLVLPAETPITLRLGKKNRGREVEVSIDGKTITEKLGTGMEVRIAGEEVRRDDGGWEGGVPSIVRGTMGKEDMAEDHWVGGLNALLKFNYPFGDQDS
ncbi:NADH kinase-like protein POS5 [Cucurbitaria berberidis CBS 394.84]|uniref:NADH kinase-like protein POS5 n=1 Tax=Cucurbitaria berberidis CBS 394.84 TaxID=1168544 RepID=A0A9P4GUA4_9PLEO|nr:NADH kinase-like protein POS5 [Cucurbitaria berberidis CBS 394.84]KAF1851171.1 NADH kinase-like protein POS5 [Cucurbitaria berberidis CBS 394.84]